MGIVTLMRLPKRNCGVRLELNERKVSIHFSSAEWCNVRFVEADLLVDPVFKLRLGTSNNESFFDEAESFPDAIDFIFSRSLLNALSNNLI